MSTAVAHCPVLLDPPLRASLIWLPVGFALALATPWLGLWPVWFQLLWHTLPLVASVVLIGWTLLTAIRLFGATGEPHRAWPLTLAQFGLFALFFFQIACHLGAEHYRWEETPAWWDWLLFALIHALRAADVFDWLEAYGLDLQVIHHESALTATCLWLFHIILDLFFIAVVLQGLVALKKRLFGQREAGMPVLRQNGFWVVTVFFVVVWLVSALEARPWRTEDLLWWPLDNLLRVLDIGDAMELYEVKLAHIPRHWWEGTLTVVCRLLIGLTLGKLVTRLLVDLSLRRLGGYGLRKDTLETLLDESSDPQLLHIVRERLERLQRTIAIDERPTARRKIIVGLALCLVLGCTAALLPSWSLAAQALVEPAVHAQHPQHEAALAALRRMGPFAASVVPSLARALPAHVHKEQQRLVATLVYLGPPGQAVLGDCLAQAEPTLAQACIAPLRDWGPRAAWVLARGLESRHAVVRAEAQAAVLLLGQEAVPALIKTMTQDKVVLYVRLLKELDPACWHLQSSTNRIYRAVADAYAVLPRLTASGLAARQQAAETLDRLGQAALPAWQDALKHRERDVRLAAAQALGKLGPAATPVAADLHAARKDREFEVRQAALAALGKIGGAALPFWQEAIQNQAWEQRLVATEALRTIIWQVSYRAKDMEKSSDSCAWTVPVLQVALNDPHSSVREMAFEALESLGPAAVPALQQALQDPQLAGRAVVRLGTLGPAALPALLQAARDPQLRKQTAMSLTMLGPAAAPAVPVLLEILKDQDASVCDAAAYALSRIGPAALPSLQAALNHRDGSVRRIATGALGELGNPGLAALQQALKHHTWEVREEAAHALGRLGPAAAPALAVLRAARQDQDERVRSAVANTIAIIEYKR